MKKSIKLMVAIAGLMVAGNAVAGSWRFANKSSYKITIVTNDNETKVLPSKKITSQTVGQSAKAWDILSMPKSGRIEMTSKKMGGGANFKYGTSINPSGNLTTGTAISVDEANFSYDNPPVFVIDTGFTGFKVEVLSLQEANAKYRFGIQP